MDIYNSEYTQEHGAENGILEDNLRKDREIAQIQRDNFRAAHRAGVRMAFGTDAGRDAARAAPGGQFRWMVEYGMTPMEAIQSATRNAAQALGRESDVGAIAVGRYGDIVAVAGDPLANVRAARGCRRGDQGRRGGQRPALEPPPYSSGSWMPGGAWKGLDFGVRRNDRVHGPRLARHIRRSAPQGRHFGRVSKLCWPGSPPRAASRR